MASTDKSSSVSLNLAKSHPGPATVNLFLQKPFLGALLGLLLTAIGLTDIVDWPLWPATLTLEHGFGIRDPFEERTTTEKTAILIALIAGNATIWAVLALGVIGMVRRIHGIVSERLPGQTDHH